MRRWIVLFLLALPVLSYAGNVRYNAAALEALEESGGPDLDLAGPLFKPGILSTPIYGISCGDQADYIVGNAGLEASIYVLLSCGNDRKMSYVKVIAKEGTGIKIRPFGAAYGDTAEVHTISVPSASSDSLTSWDSPFVTDSLRIWIPSGAGLVEVNAF